MHFRADDCLFRLPGRLKAGRQIGRYIHTEPRDRFLVPARTVMLIFSDILNPTCSKAVKAPRDRDQKNKVPVC